MDSHLAAVDLEEAGRDDQVHGAIALRIQRHKHILGGHRVDAVLAVLHLAVELAAHGVCLAGAGLAVGEARRHAALEDGPHQWLGCVSGGWGIYFC